jgi:CubicO group peptidase (beta-lactamase class C family)
MSARHEQNWDQLVEFIPEVMGKQGVPGVVVGILHEGETRAAGFGVNNVDHALPVTDETLFQIGSITKTFTATAMMRLVEMGMLELDAPVRTYVPDFKVADDTVSSQVIIRHLLTHMGGWFGDFFLDTGAGNDALPKYVASMADLEQLTPLDAAWSYNNAAFCLAGYVVEVVTGKRYEAALKELVLEPLGLESSFFDPGDVMTYRFAVGHEGGQVARPWPLPRAAYPAGGMTCSVHDLLAYARFHLGDGTTEEGTRLLTPESLSLMQTTQAPIWKDETVGLSWILKGADGTRQVTHGGGTKGQVSLLTLIPEHNFSVAVFTNADRGGFVTDAVTRRALKGYLDVDVPKPEPMETTEEALASFAGRYGNPFTDIELGMLSGRLVAQEVNKLGFPDKDSPPAPSPPPMSLTMCEKDCLLVLDGPYKGETIRIGRKQDGTVGWIRAGGRISNRQE